MISFDIKNFDQHELSWDKKKKNRNLVEKTQELKKKNEKLKYQLSKIEDSKKIQMKIENFIEDKELERSLKYEIKNLKRKIEINQKKYNKALIIEKRSTSKLGSHRSKKSTRSGY